MGRFETTLDQHQIQHGYSLLKLMEHLDHEMAVLNQQRLQEGLEEQERSRLTRVKRSHLRKIQDCIAELENSGFNQWLLERRLA
jgi:hypothetical protein